MKKSYLLIILFLSIKVFAQKKYDRMWGTLVPVYNEPIKPFSPIKTIRTNQFVSEVNLRTGNLYVVSINGSEIYEYSEKSPIPKLVYTIPDEVKGMSSIENIKFDSKDNIIITGRTYNEKLSTREVYSESIIYGISSRPTFISKICVSGDLIWTTYFHDIAPNTSHLTVDKDDNIYILNRRNKKTIASPTYFQSQGDLNSVEDYQDVITKLSSKGNHVWSTFYSKDNSHIKSIEAGMSGLYIYGEHFGSDSFSNYFGTFSCYQEYASGVVSGGTKNSSNVFLSKFNFDGTREWSTYFGDKISNVPLDSSLKNSHAMVVIDDVCYILTLHKETSHKVNNLSTEGVFLQYPTSSIMNTTLSKFTNKGEKSWTTYLYSGENIFSNGRELYVGSSSILTTSYKIQLPITDNAYQSKPGSDYDVYTSVFSLDGRELKYSSYYGYEGRDSGVTLPTNKGFYIIGNSVNNEKEKSLFVTKKAINKEFVKSGTKYIGDFIVYFSTTPSKK